MKKDARESLDAYYREAGSWSEDERESLRASKKTAWMVASGAAAIAFFEALAIVVMMPLKTVEPYTLMVDKTTGFVQELKPIESTKIAPDTALTQSFLVQYVIAREGYDRGSVSAQYRKVILWSQGAAQTDYKNVIQASNPTSPLNFPANTIVDTRVLSVTSLGATSAMVRFETIRRDGGGSPQGPQAWVAKIDYRFSTGPLSSEDRFVNPLGFQVTRYNRDQEALSGAPPPVAAPPPISQPQVIAPPTGAPAPIPTAAPRQPGPEVVL